MGKIKKVPVILQMEALECGAACLAMILAYYKKWVPLEKLRQDCGVSRDGSNAKNIYLAANQHGLHCNAYRYNREDLAGKASLPAVLWWNQNHFVVLDGFSRGKVHLTDPALGRVIVSDDEFEKSYSGICMEFKPTEAFVPEGKREGAFSFLRRYMRGNKQALAAVVITGTLVSLTGVLYPVITRIFTDYILDSANLHWLFALMAFFGAMIIFRFAAGLVNSVSIQRVTGKIAISSNSKFLWHILRMPMAFFSQRMAGDLADRQKENDNVAAVLVLRMAPILMNMVLLLFYLGVMLQYSVSLSVIGIVTVILNLLLVRGIAAIRTDIAAAQLRDEGKLNSAIVSGISMIESIKASGAEKGFFERLSGYHASVVHSKERFTHVERYLTPLSTLLQNISQILVLVCGAWMIMRGVFSLTAGILIAFQSFMTVFLDPVNELLQAGQEFQEMRSSMVRIEDVMRYPADIPEKIDPEEEKGLENAQKLSGDIRVENLSFGYSPLAEPLIKDFSLCVKPGSKIGLIGGSGSGKSTVAKLLSGLYKPRDGKILYDGKDISEIPRAVFCGSVSVVDQNVVIFADTIENNIKMWDSTIEDFEMIMAARDADIHEEILKRRGGYKYMLEEEGRNLSGGERQRIDIVRVLAQDPSIIIMDEATSALDAVTEYKITEAIRARGITCILVAHRLSTIRDCDEILVMDKGVVRERGTHEELMKLNGLYRELVILE